MPKTLQEWKVLPHQKLSRIDENLLTVVGELRMPLGKFPRRMTVVRLGDSRLIFYSAIALDETEMTALELYGIPAYLIVPSGIHRLDAKIWKDRYPELTVIAPAGARRKVAEVVPVDRTTIDFEDPTVEYMTVPGTAGHEAALLVRTPSGTTLIVNDVIWNLEDLHGFSRVFFHMFGFAGSEPRVPRFVQRKAIKDKAAFRAQLESWAEIRDLNRIIVSHGEIVTRDAPMVLRDLAHSLAA